MLSAQFGKDVADVPSLRAQLALDTEYNTRPST